MHTQKQESRVSTTVPRAERIARLNDELRTNCLSGLIAITKGVQGLPGFRVDTLMKALRDYDGFDIDNDPHGERDFGDLEYCGASLFFKIDYYSHDYNWASTNPADPTVTARVLTVMLIDEY